MLLSVVILAKNEAEMIGDCLDSLTALGAGEVIVIDDQSSDDTATTARYKKAKVLSHPKKNFSEAREYGAVRSNGEWILYIDADERISSELARDIRDAISKGGTAVSGYRLRRVNFYLGVRWPKEEWITRLVRKSELRGWQGEVHETAQVSGSVLSLPSPLYHHTHRSLNEMVENTLVWSQIEARLRFAAHHPPVFWWHIFRMMMTVFGDYYISQGGWKVGTVGLIESIYQAFSIFITYARLWELQQRKI